MGRLAEYGDSGAASAFTADGGSPPCVYREMRTFARTKHP